MLPDQHYGVDTLETLVGWLIGWPAGLKLNANLDRFLGNLFLWFISLWAGESHFMNGCMVARALTSVLAFLSEVKVLIPSLIRVIGLSGVLGFSVILSFMSDLLAFLLLHLFSFYSVAATLYRSQVKLLCSLGNMFRGKKWNTLRHRIDAHDYDLDQLLLGTVLFTLLFFLFPTTAVFYVVFCGVR